MTDPATRLEAALAGRYRVLREIGQGGMATVYLAHDVKHDRQVALKVLRPELAAVIGGERFLAEIRVTAHLQHPHILPLHDSGDANGTVFYVMPYVEGESLRDRLTREKQLPIADAVRIATEVASALDYAHRHGVIHRDIKPENVLLHDGQALVADFGIALAVNSAGGTRMTETGMSLGTPHYMSPEQAMGEREITARSDVYALGAMTYEMLVGEPPFTGPTAQAIVAKVLSTEPTRPTVARRSVPPHVEDAVLTALEKLPADRWGSAAEFAEALKGGGTAERRTDRRQTAGKPSVLPPFRRSIVVAVGALLLGLPLGILIDRWRRPTPAPLPASRLAILTPPGGTGLSGRGRIVDISSDGGTIVFFGNSPVGGGRIYVHRLDRLESVQLEGSEFGVDLHLSPDASEIIYGSLTGEMVRLPIGGGRPRSVPGGVSTSFLGWAPDGVIWYSDFDNGAMYRVPPGGAPELVFRPESTEYGQVGIQQVLPGGRTALVTAFSGTNETPLLVLDLKSGKRTLIPVGMVVEARYAQGHLVYARSDGTLHAVAFDAAKGSVTGAPVQIGEDVSLTGTGFAQFAVADNGTVVYVPQQPRELVLLDRSGRAERVTEARRNFHSPRFSSDGRRIAIDFNTTEGRDVWILDQRQGTMTRATFERDGHDPVWLPGGRDLAFASSRGSGLAILRTRPGATSRDSLFASTKLTYTGSWLPDGRRIISLANEMRPGSGSDLVILDSAGALRPYIVTPFNEGWPAVSPDGRWLAFASDLSGRLEVYVQPLESDGDRIQVSLDGGSEPVWGPDGRELFYRSLRGGQVELVAAAFATAPEPHIATRTALFPVDEYDAAQPHANYDVRPDGRSFVMVRRSPAHHLVVIQSLLELVRRLQGSGADGS